FAQERQPAGRAHQQPPARVAGLVEPAQRPKDQAREQQQRRARLDHDGEEAVIERALHRKHHEQSGVPASRAAARDIGEDQLDEWQRKDLREAGPERRVAEAKLPEPLEPRHHRRLVEKAQRRLVRPGPVIGLVRPEIEVRRRRQAQHGEDEDDQQRDDEEDARRRRRALRGQITLDRWKLRSTVWSRSPKAGTTPVSSRAMTGCGSLSADASTTTAVSGRCSVRDVCSRSNSMARMSPRAAQATHSSPARCSCNAGSSRTTLSPGWANAAAPGVVTTVTGIEDDALSNGVLMLRSWRRSPFSLPRAGRAARLPSR